MKKWLVLPVGLQLAWAVAAWSKESYSGEWSYQALNAGDTNFKVEQAGDEITLYRVLHPEFEGKHFKLEHLFRGRIAAGKIEGKLYVREEGMKEFESLRPFAGEIRSQDLMVVDDMPLKRVGAASSSVSETPGPRPPPATPYRKVVVQRGGEADLQADPDQGRKVSPAASEAPAAIPRLIPATRRVQTEKARQVEGKLREGDAFFEKKQYQDGMASYQAALQLDPGKVELLYQLGLGHGILGSLAAKSGRRHEAAGHFQNAIRFWERAVRYDPYNWGAKENIRRAKQKLVGLESP